MANESLIWQENLKAQVLDTNQIQHLTQQWYIISEGLEIF